MYNEEKGMSYANNEGLDQHAYSYSLIWAFSVRRHIQHYPANTHRSNNVVTTSLQRHDVAATL